MPDPEVREAKLVIVKRTFRKMNYLGKSIKLTPSISELADRNNDDACEQSTPRYIKYVESQHSKNSNVLKNQVARAWWWIPAVIRWLVSLRLSKAFLPTSPLVSLASGDFSRFRVYGGRLLTC